jgi:hypothetical protein
MEAIIQAIHMQHIKCTKAATKNSLVYSLSSNSVVDIWTLRYICIINIVLYERASVAAPPNKLTETEQPYRNRQELEYLALTGTCTSS